MVSSLKRFDLLVDPELLHVTYTLTKMQESEIIPYQASELPDAKRVVVFAPHPDDEVFGCGGVLALHALAQHRVSVILLTAGEKASLGEDASTYAQMRLSESAEAARVLAIDPPKCWHLPDRGVAYGESLVAKIMQAILAEDADLIYAPALWESHPDHRATALAVIEAVRRLKGARQLRLYELSAPLRPNCLIDITRVWTTKLAAMKVFASQIERTAYPDFIGALNRYRALTLDEAMQHAEAFEVYAPADLGHIGRMPFQSEHRRLLQRNILSVSQQLPLVTVIVRSAQRPTLEQALDSLALQTYQNLQVVLVDVEGKGLNAFSHWTNAFAFPVIVATRNLPMTRSQSANLGLASAQGTYCLFLDDDDWFFPDHIAKLVQCAISNPSAKAVHTAVRCFDMHGNPIDQIFDFSYVAGELRFGNFLPIHAVLFETNLAIESGCRFDEQFDLYEDWDFWLQVEQHTGFAFVSGVSAAYRIHPGAGLGVTIANDLARDATNRIFDKWSVRWSASDFRELIVRSLDRRHLLRRIVHVESQSGSLQSENMSLKSLAEQCQADTVRSEVLADQARQDADHFRMAHDAACRDRDFARGECAASEREANRARVEALQSRQDALHQNQLAMAARAEIEVLQQALADAREQSTRESEALRIQHAAELQHVRGEWDRANAQALELAREHALELKKVARASERAQSLQLALEQGQLVQSNQKEELARCAVRVDDLERALANQQATEAALMGSTSWRITKPVRMAGNLLKRTQALLGNVAQSGPWRMGSGYALRHVVRVMRQEGLAGLRLRVSRLSGLIPGSPLNGPVVAAAAADEEYTRWIAAFDGFDATQRQSLDKDMLALAEHPMISIIMPVYNTVPEHLSSAIQSVLSQVYPHWELCICDDASSQAHVRAMLATYAQQDARIRFLRHASNGHISKATNSAIDLATGQYLAFLDHDDELSPHALLRVVQALSRRSGPVLVYSDEDKIDAQGRRFDPYFKPDFNLGLLRSHNYMCHFAVYEAALVRQLGGAREGFEGAQDYDLALRAVDLLPEQAIIHIPHVLYHWRAASGSTAAGHTEKSYAFAAGQRALQAHLDRRGLSGEVEQAPEAPGMYRIRWRLPLSEQEQPMVSIVVPTRNGYDILRQCLESLKKTRYSRYEVIVVDNGSDDDETLQYLENARSEGQVRVLRDDSPFNFSALNNRAVREMSAGDFILLLNNDIEVTHPDWLCEMVGSAMEPGIGCVGARLWYPDGRLQHGGVILVCGVAGHAHKYLQRGQHGYMGRAVLAQDMIGVTAACLLVRKSIYLEVGGLDEGLAVAFNDIDFCLRVHYAGYRNHWTPFAELIHHESLTRGYEDTPEKQQRFRGEIEKMQARWPALLAHDDPCYSPNLTAKSEDFSIAWPPRRLLP